MMKLKVCMIKSSSYIVLRYTRKKIVAIGIVACAAHSRQHRQQQTHDISFVLYGDYTSI